MSYTGEWKRPSEMTQEEIHARVMANTNKADRDNDGDVDFQDLPPEQRNDTSNDGLPRYDDPVPDERGEVRRLKELRARDVLEERARARREAEHDQILQEEFERAREQSKNPIRKHVERVGRGVADLLKQNHATQPPRNAPRKQPQPVRVQAPPNDPYARGRGRMTRPPDQYRPAPSMGARIQSVDAGLYHVFGGEGISRPSTRPAPRPRADISTFTAQLLPRTAPRAPPAGKPATVGGLNDFVGKIGGVKKKTKTPSKQPDFTKMFGLKI